MSPAEIFDAIDDMQLTRSDTDRALVVAPAALLCDALSDPRAEAARDNALRMGRLRCAVRLPPGLLLGAPRQRLGLWVLGPESAPMALEQRWTMVADLTEIRLSGDVVSDLATDVVASLESRQVLHGFRYARALRTADLLAAGGDLVPIGMSTRRRPGAASEEAIGLRRLVRSAGLDGDLRVDPNSGRPMAPLTIAEALSSGVAKMVPGLRLPREPLPPGALRLIGASEVAGIGGADSVDALELTRRHQHVVRTEPGDVVFVSTPRPRALVDTAGLSVVAYPARVLRFAPGSGIVPAAAARAINSLPGDARAWRGWTIPVVDLAHADHVADVLRHAEREAVGLRKRLAALDEFSDRVAGSVGVGLVTVSLDNAQNHEKRESMHTQERSAR